MKRPHYLLLFLFGLHAISFGDEPPAIQRNPFTPFVPKMERPVSSTAVETATATTSAAEAVASSTEEGNNQPARLFPPAVAPRGVVLSTSGPKYALFDNELLAVGDQLQGWTIQDIQLKKVVLRRGSQRVERVVGQQIDRSESSSSPKQQTAPQPFSSLSAKEGLGASQTLRFLNLGRELENKLRQGDIQGMTPYINPMLDMIFKGEKPRSP